MINVSVIHPLAALDSKTNVSLLVNTAPTAHLDEGIIRVEMLCLHH